MTKLGYKATLEHRKHISDAHIGMRKPWAGGSKKGRKLSKETREKMSRTRIGHQISSATKDKIRQALTGRKRPELSGEKNPCWNPNREEVAVNAKRNTIEHRTWARAVKNRDGWKCRMKNKDCTDKIEAHHILPYSKYPELRYEINNGITLCKFHHPRTRDKETMMSPYFQELVKNHG